MLLAENYIPALKFGAKINLNNLVASGLVTAGNVWWVDGDNGDDTATGQTPATAFKTIAFAISTAAANDAILIKPRKTTALSTDPVSYAETFTIPNSKPNLKLIGIDGGKVQGGIPQIKIGAGSTAMLTVKAPGCVIANLGFNGVGSTGGGITLADDGGSTAVSFGTVIMGCHFKNCKKHATHASAGGAITIGASASDNGSWQLRIQDNVFYKNVGDIIMICNGAVPQDYVIQGNVFQSATVSATDCNINLAGPSLSGVMGLTLKDNVFGAQPALSSGDTALFMKLDGCYGTMANNFFGDSGTIATTFSATGSGATIPTTVFMAGNYSETGLITR